MFAVDLRLIQDGTYFIVESAGTAVGCGGWSRWRTLYGASPDTPGGDVALEPRTEPARVRAFFVHPDWARRGIGRRMLGACEEAIIRHGFRKALLMATLAGQPLYAACGYSVEEHLELPLPLGWTLPVVRMSKDLASARPPPGLQTTSRPGTPRPRGPGPDWTGTTDPALPGKWPGGAGWEGGGSPAYFPVTWMVKRS